MSRVGFQVSDDSKQLQAASDAASLVLPPHPAYATNVALATLSPQTGEGVLELDYASLLPTFRVAATKTIVQ